MRQFEIDGITFKVREFIPFTEMGSINLFGLMSVSVKMAKINEKYIKANPKEETEDEVDYKVRLAGLYSEEDQLELQKLNFSNISLMQPMLSCLILTPKLSKISMGMGLKLMKNPIVLEIFNMVMADIQSGMTGESASKKV